MPRLPEAPRTPWHAKSGAEVRSACVECRSISVDCPTQSEEEVMRIISRRMAIVSIAAGLACLAVANDSWAERERQLAGTWMLTSNVNTREDGTKADIFGSNPKGVLILSPDGYFAVVNTRADLPK